MKASKLTDAQKAFILKQAGSETLFTVDAGGEVLSYIIHRRVSVQSSDAVQLSLKPGATHFFDAKGGLRL
jgi:ABC-type sugar transport system ATPase subunit